MGVGDTKPKPCSTCMYVCMGTVTLNTGKTQLDELCKNEYDKTRNRREKQKQETVNKHANIVTEKTERNKHRPRGSILCADALLGTFARHRKSSLKQNLGDAPGQPNAHHKGPKCVPKATN